MTRVLLAAVLALVVPAAVAAPILAPVPTNAYITEFLPGVGETLDIAWAAPCRVIDPSCGAVDLSFQSGLGWRLATPAEAAELAASLLGTDFVFAGANVDFPSNVDVSNGSGANFVFGSPGADAACASPWFSPFHLHCDWGNAPGNGGGAVGWGFGQPGEVSFAEGIVVRDAVPEPGTMALLGAAVLGFGAMRRRKS